MSEQWLDHETSKHQDHVIAHVIGATALGSFVHDQIAYLLIDIGFIWMIFLDGEMGLVPQVMAIAELDVDEATRAAISRDVDLLQRFGVEIEGLQVLKPFPPSCQIAAIDFFSSQDRRFLGIKCESTKIAIETSLDSGNVTLDL